MLRDICNVLAAMGGTAIELYEWQRSSVTMPRLPNNSAWSAHATHSGSMNFTGIRLAHAAVKADYLIVRNYALPSLGFLLQMDQIIDFGSAANLRLLAGSSNVLNDVTQSSLIGRVGQGLAILFAAHQGYAFTGHLASDPSVIAHLPTAASERVADFLFESGSGDRMILESKATFSLDENKCSPVKTVLKKALEEQVDPWMGIVTPSPSKGYAVYSCVREVGSATPSAIVFVDPPERRGDFQVELPPSWVRRRNYAAWLRAMGLRDAADRLRGDSDSRKADAAPSPTRFRRVRVGGREFAVFISLDRAEAFPDARFAMGIEVEALKLVSATISGDADALSDYAARPLEGIEDGPRLSIMPDGTLFGLVDVGMFDGVEEVIL